jgi:hypothetical protein
LLTAEPLGCDLCTPALVINQNIQRDTLSIFLGGELSLIVGRRGVENAKAPLP